MRREGQRRDPATRNELASNLIPTDNEPSKWPIKVESGREPKSEWPKADVPLSDALEESGSEKESELDDCEVVIFIKRLKGNQVRERCFGKKNIKVLSSFITFLQVHRLMTDTAFWPG